MRKYFWISCLLLSLFVNTFSQAPVTYPSPDTCDFPDAWFETPRTYSGSSLFGYMNGGAELYLEYGCSGAWIGEIHLMGGKYKTEIYRMKGPEEAFGIFSVLRYQCNSNPPLSPFTCQTKYQLQICSGPFYISIINSTGDSTDSAASLRIGRAIVNKIKEPPADIAGYLPDMPCETVNRKAILAKGKLGIMNAAPDLADYFGESGGYCAVIIIREKETMLSVRFTAHEDMDAFASMHNWKTEMIPAGKGKISTGETITRISDHHLLIEIEN